MKDMSFITLGLFAAMLFTALGYLPHHSRTLGMRADDNPNIPPDEPITLQSPRPYQANERYEGEDGFHFCGRRKCFGVPYCEHHAAIAYNPTARKRRAA